MAQDMTDISVDIFHTIGKEEAKRRIEGLVKEIQDQPDKHPTIKAMNAVWSNGVMTFTAEVYDLKVNGSVSVLDTDVKVKVFVNLPLVALPFKGKVVKDIQETFSSILVSFGEKK